MSDTYSFTENFQYDDVEYVILETTTEGYFVVAKKEDIDKKRFPVPVYIVPNGIDRK